MSPRADRHEALLAKFLYEAIEATDIRRVLIILREEKANPNFVLPEYGIAPFHFVIGKDSKKFAYEATKLMLRFGGDPNVRSEEGLTPVHVATAWNRTSILYLLLKSGGDPFLKDEDGKTAVDYALEEGLIRALEVINYHVMHETPSKKVYLYHNNVQAEYSAQPILKGCKPSQNQEEIYYFPGKLSHDDEYNSEISITHSISIPSNTSIKIESSVTSDDDQTTKHHYQVTDKNIKHTIMTYLKNCKVYECTVPGNEDSLKLDCSSFDQRKASDNKVKSCYLPSPNHKSPSAENFSSVCNNLTKELNEKLNPTEFIVDPELNVSTETTDLYTTCLLDSNEIEFKNPFTHDTQISPCRSAQNCTKKCARNIFINECNINPINTPIKNPNFPCKLAEKDVCRNCSDILLNNFKLCHHSCHSDVTKPIYLEHGICGRHCLNEHVKCNDNNCSPLRNGNKYENGNFQWPSCDKIERNNRILQVSPKKLESKATQVSVSSLNKCSKPPPIGFVGDEIDNGRKLNDQIYYDSAEKPHIECRSYKKIGKTTPNSNFLKNRAKLEKAFLNCVNKSKISFPSVNSERKASEEIKRIDDISELNHSCNLTYVLENGELDSCQINGSNNSKQSTEELVDFSKTVESTESVELNEENFSSGHNLKSNDQVSNCSIINVDQINSDYQRHDLNSPKKCNICEYNKMEDTGAKKSYCSELGCTNEPEQFSTNTGSNIKNNELSLTVAHSPSKICLNSVELHSKPFDPSEAETQNECFDEETDGNADLYSQPSIVFETLKKDEHASSNRTLDQELVTDCVPVNIHVLNSGDSLTNISDNGSGWQSNLSTLAPEECNKKISVDESKNDLTNHLDIAFFTSRASKNSTSSPEIKAVIKSGIDVGNSVNASVFDQTSQTELLHRNKSDLSEIFLSSSEKCSPSRKHCHSSAEFPQNNLQSALKADEYRHSTGYSSSDYYSTNEHSRSRQTSDNEHSHFTQVNASNRESSKGAALEGYGQNEKNQFFSTNISEDIETILLTSDDEPDSKADPTFNICEEYKYVDKEKNIVIKEARLKNNTVRLSALNGLENLTVRKHQKTHEISDSAPESSETSSVSSLSYDTDALRLELKQKGYVPGPITFTTKKLYLKKLKKITKSQSQSKTSSSEINILHPDSYCYEIDRTISQGDDKEWQNLLQSWSHLETKMSSYFESPTRSAKWRGGISKSSFTYLLLDPRVTDNLPVRSQSMSSLAVWTVFLKAIFYVGKGKRSRPYSHLYETIKFWNAGNASCSEKVKFILDLWKNNHGVICLSVFQNIMPVEALTREAAMIEALGLNNLKNEKHGDYYGPCASWSSKQKRQLGCFLLYRALIVFLADGERQLKPYDVE